MARSSPFRGRRGNLLKLVWHDRHWPLHADLKRLEAWPPYLADDEHRARSRCRQGSFVETAAGRLRVAGDGAQPEAGAGRLI